MRAKLEKSASWAAELSEMTRYDGIKTKTELFALVDQAARDALASFQACGGGSEPPAPKLDGTLVAWQAEARLGWSCADLPQNATRGVCTPGIARHATLSSHAAPRTAAGSSERCRGPVDR